MDDLIGQDVAGFRILEELGRGGMGVVYLAEQDPPRRRVALKVLSPALSHDPPFRARFARESEAAATTEHPNIVPIFAAGEAKGSLYIAMRYVEGTDLRERIVGEGALPADRAVAIVSQMADALDAAHLRDLVHRDVKPGNILLDQHGNAYLTDFGLIKRSEVSSGITRTGQFMGSIEYCAPEQIRGEPVDRRADVYSLACVLYECLAGTPPFRRESEIATLYAHLEQSPPSLPTSLPNAPELDAVLAKAMAKRASDRYASAGEFARAVRQAVGVTSGERGIPPRRSRMPLVWIGAAVVAIAALGVAVALLSRDDVLEVGTTGTTAPGSAQGPDSVVRLDPATGEVAQTVDGIYATSSAAFDEFGLAAGEGGVWVGYTSAVQQVDPLTATVRRTIPVAQLTSIVVPAVGFRTVWVTTGRTLERINPATGQLLRSTQLAPPFADLSQFVVRIAVGEGAVWLSTSTTVLEVDPVYGKVVRELDVGSVDGLAAGEGAVWVIDELSGELRRLDPATLEATGSVALAGGLDAVAVGAGRAWVLDRGAGTVIAVDAGSLDVIDTVRVGSDEAAMIFGGDSLWLADGSDGSVTRIDPQTLLTTVFPVDGNVANVAVDADSGGIWVLVTTP